MARKFKPRTVQTEAQQVAETWRIYCEQRCKSARENSLKMQYLVKELKPGILIEELENAIAYLENNKVCDLDGIKVAVLKTGREELTHKI